MTPVPSLGGRPREHLDGVALALGVSLEIGVMAMATRILRRADPTTPVAAAMATVTVRWALVAVLTDPVFPTVLQLLHGVVFGIYWIGIVGSSVAPPRGDPGERQAVVITATASARC